MEWLGRVLGALFGLREARGEVIPSDQEAINTVQRLERANSRVLKAAQERPQKVYVYGGKRAEYGLRGTGAMGQMGTRGTFDTARALGRSRGWAGYPPDSPVHPDDYVALFATNMDTDPYFTGPHLPTDPVFTPDVLSHELGHFLVHTTDREGTREYNRQFNKQGLFSAQTGPDTRRNSQYFFQELLATLLGYNPSSQNLRDLSRRGHLGKVDPRDTMKLLQMIYRGASDRTPSPLPTPKPTQTPVVKSTKKGKKR